MTPPTDESPQPPSLTAILRDQITALERQREICATKVLKLAAMVKQVEADEAFLDGKIAQTRYVLGLLPVEKPA